MRPLPSTGVVLRRVVICALCAGFLAAPAPAGAAAPIRGQTLLPGVIYSRQVEFTSHGPVVMHVISAPKPTGLYALKPILSNNALIGRERVTSMERRYAGEATVAGVNGDLFSFTDGHPTGGSFAAASSTAAPPTSVPRSAWTRTACCTSTASSSPGAGRARANAGSWG